MNVSLDDCWVLVAAAGSGSRMQSATPKQYLSLAGKPVLQHVLERFLDWSRHVQVALVVNPDSTGLAGIVATENHRVHSVAGGATRAESVLAGLRFIDARAGAATPVLIHDAARPLVRQVDVLQLLEVTQVARQSGYAQGGILATPATDTIKLADEAKPDNQKGQKGQKGQRILKTLDRERLWQARTPQCFMLEQLLPAMSVAGITVTDEASAMEQAGHTVVMVECSTDNIKITRSEDLVLAEALLQLQSEETGS